MNSSDDQPTRASPPPRLGPDQRSGPVPRPEPVPRQVPPPAARPLPRNPLSRPTEPQGPAAASRPLPRPPSAGPSPAPAPAATAGPEAAASVHAASVHAASTAPPPAPPPLGRAHRLRPGTIRAIDWSSGRPLNGRYRMLQKLGEGGMGAVWLCEDMLLRRKVALKTLFADRNSVADEDLERFRREVAIAHTVNHPGVARTYDLGESAGVHYLTMEFLEGETLVDRIKRGEAMTSDELRAIAVPLCKGLRAAHRAGIVHRDLKPANIMLVRDDRRAVIMDFGIAAAVDEPQSAPEEPLPPAANVPWEVTSAGRGTPTYMAPEQWAGQRGDARTDIYALGIILYICLTKKVPYKASTAQELAHLHTSAPVPKVEALAPGVDPDLAKLITQCLAKKPEDRPASMDEVVERLTRGERRKQRSLQVLGVAAASAVLLSLVGLGLWTMAHGAVIREMRPAQARLAEVVALQLNAQDLEQLKTKADIDSPAFKKVHAVLERYHKRYPELMGLYAMRATEVPNKYTIVADLFPRDTDRDGDGEISQEEQGAPPGTPYDGSDAPSMAEALRLDAPVADEDFTSDAWGLSLSGYAAVLQDGVRTRYFVGADARNTPLASFQLRLVVILALSWVTLVLAFALGRNRLEKKRFSGDVD